LRREISALAVQNNACNLIFRGHEFP
jgi:hypothetical protein